MLIINLLVISLVFLVIALWVLIFMIGTGKFEEPVSKSQAEPIKHSKHEGFFARHHLFLKITHAIDTVEKIEGKELQLEVLRGLIMALYLSQTQLNRNPEGKP